MPVGASYRNCCAETAQPASTSREGDLGWTIVALPRYMPARVHMSVQVAWVPCERWTGCEKSETDFFRRTSDNDKEENPGNAP
jgi:hypothetical protein